MSHSPRGATSSRTSPKRCRSVGFILSTEPGDHSGVSIWRQAVWRWPSSISGIHRYAGLGSATVTAEFENTSVLWYALRMSSMRVRRKYC